MGLAGMAGFEPADDGVKGRCLTAWRHPCIGGTGGSRTHARLSPPISFQDCSLMTTWVLFRMWRTVQVHQARTALPVFPGRHRKEILKKMGGYGHPWSR